MLLYIFPSLILQILLESTPVFGYFTQIAAGDQYYLLFSLLAALTYVFRHQRSLIWILYRSFLQLLKSILDYSRFLLFLMPPAFLVLWIACRYLPARDRTMNGSGLSLFLLGHILLVPVIMGLIPYLHKKIKNKTLRNISFVLLGSSLWTLLFCIDMLWNCMLYLAEYCGDINSFNLWWNLVMLILHGLLLFYLEARTTEVERDLEDFNASDLVWSCMHQLVPFPLDARFMSVYTLLRLRNLKPKPAFIFAGIQSIFTLFLAMKLDLPLTLAKPLPVIALSLLSFIIMYRALHLNSQQIKRLMMVYALYRIFLGLGISTRRIVLGG